MKKGWNRSGTSRTPSPTNDVKAEVAPKGGGRVNIFLIKVKLFCLKVLKKHGKYGTMLL